MKRTINLLFFLIISSFVAIQTAEQQQFSIPIQYKLSLDRAVAAKDTDKIIFLLTSEAPDLEDFKNNYPFAMKLYRILIDDSAGEDFTIESRYIPITTITDVAKALAQEGGNERFLRNLRNRPR